VWLSGKVGEQLQLGHSDVRLRDPPSLHALDHRVIEVAQRAGIAHERVIELHRAGVGADRASGEEVVGDTLQGLSTSSIRRRFQSDASPRSWSPHAIRRIEGSAWLMASAKRRYRSTYPPGVVQPTCQSP